MKISENWLREWANPALDSQQLAAVLTMAGLEIDSISPVAGAFDRVIVAEIIQTTRHPEADKLSLCDVNSGDGTIVKIVCGAQNVRAGLKVALAQIGATLPGGMVIKEARLRGELSQGMLCSASELGLMESSEGIIELDDDAIIGTDLRVYLGLDDAIFDIDLTPNRADCLSVIGVAREVAALTDASMLALAPVSVVPAIDAQQTVILQAPDACPHYCGRIIRHVNSQAITPLWMRERLRRSGIRCIHPIVDITNYVMLECGQPMHAFDANKLQGDVVVRYAQNDEQLTLLDGQEVILRDNVLVIADSHQPQAIAGVMGGIATAVDDTTVDIFLESAWFNPLAIAGIARSYGLFTDSSQRFERGVSLDLQLVALERATSLILEITGGKAGPINRVKENAHQLNHQSIVFNPAKVKQLTGVDISESVMIKTLTSLGMTVNQQNPLWDVTVPAHRFDLRMDVDLVEEIIRIYGYDNIKGDIMTAAVQAGNSHPSELLSTRLNHFFTARHYLETISYSFVDPQLQQALYPDSQAMEVLNPISSELSAMRVGMWSGLIASMIYNIHRQQTAIKFFEHGVVFAKLDNGAIEERECLAGLLVGDIGAMSWNEPRRKYDFYDAKGDLQALFSSLNCHHVSFESATHHALHPGKSAKIMIDGQLIGWCGVLHPRISDALDVQDDVILFELELAYLLPNKTKIPRYQSISKFPQIRRDLSLLVDNDITVAQLDKVIHEVVGHNWLKSFEVFDVYTGESIPVGKKSLAVALILQAADRTLVDAEINDVISAIITKLGDRFAITLRE